MKEARPANAAIVSREMGIPCIVGSKNATEVLKEGQIVTVDAVHGMVFDGEVELGQSAPQEKVAAVSISAPVTGTKIYCEPCRS